MAHLEYAGGSVGPPFEPYNDAASSYSRWKAWMRNFQYYIEGQIGLADKQKVSRLLHQAGPEVQEIYENLKDEIVEGANEYDKCVKRLNAYFQPSANTAYERQKFRSMEIKDGESCSKYIIRLRTQAQFCNFGKAEEAIIDQIIEKCNNKDLKRKLMKKGSNLTLKQVVELTKIYEIEQDMFKSKITEEKEKNEDISINRIQRQNTTTCYRCGRRGHLAKDRNCPAIDAKCDKCGIKGHFEKCCKTKQAKNKVNNKKKKRYVKYVIEEDSSSDESEYIDSDDNQDEQNGEQVNSVFEVSSKSEGDNKCDILVDNKVTCRFIIDSGASINIVDKKLFKKMLSKGVCLKRICTSKTQKFHSYGGKEIPAIGMFEVKLYSPESGIKIKSKLLVYDGQGPALLSKEASIQLGLLRLGPYTSTVNLASKSHITKQIVLTEYPMLFDGIGKLKNFKLKIPIDPNVKLIAQPVRRQPFSVRGIEENLIQELLDNDIIEPVTGPTPCVSPSHIVRKKEKGQYRLVVDMRKANEGVLRERVPLPTFEELLADLNGCKYFSSLDIKWGYHQLELEEDSRIITVFSSSLGLFRYKRLFFGIRCASEMFQRVIAQILQGIEGVANSQDDIRIGGRTREEHDQRLKQVLERLKESGLTLNEKKCSFGETEINFLGHHLSEKGIKPTNTSQQVVQEFREPQNKAEVRSFLGLVNFSARFIPNFSTLTEPLRHLTKKDSEFVWNEKHRIVFDKLKTLILKAPALSYYDKDAETTLVTDASPVGIAAVLIQHQLIDNQIQPVVIKYISKALSPTEQRYSQTEKEALAIVWACENLYMYLIGKQFNIVSDHKPLEIIYSTNSKPSARIQRWVLRLQPYTFKVIYKPGKSNIADPVSRLLNTEKVAEKTEDHEDSMLIAMIGTTIETVTIEEIQKATLDDLELQNLAKAIETDVWSKDLRKYELIKLELCVVNNIIMRGTRIIIPQKLVPKILELGHEGHISVNPMKAKLRSKVWWKAMDKDIEYWVDTCEGCRLVKQNTYPEPIVTTELPRKVWELVAIDYLGPLPSGHYLLFIVDYYSRYYEVVISRNQTAENTIEALEKIIAGEGIMDEIVCDNGPAFRDERFKIFLKSQGIRLRHTTPLWPQANGEVERQNRNVLRRLRIAQGLKLDWKKELLTYLSAYRTTPHSSTGVPPGNIFRGRAIRTKIPQMVLDYSLDDESIRDMDRYKKDCYKQYADDRRRAKISEITPGDKVLIKQRKENKLTTPYSPVEHTVIWKSGNSIAAQTPDGKIVRRNSSYFQPIKERDMKRFNVKEREIPQEKEEIQHTKQNERKSKEREMSVNDERDEGQDVTKMTSMTNNPDMTNNHSQARPVRKRQMPGKYNDFLLSLILDTIES